VSTLGIFRPGGSPVHQLPAGVKLSVLVAAGVGSVFLDEPWQVAVALGVVAIGYALARLSLRVLLQQARPLLWVLLLVGAFHVLVNGWERAVVVCGVILVLVLLAGLVTLTTRTSDLVDALVRALTPLRPVGVDPQRIGLLLALGIRSVFVVAQIAEEVRDAQRARGLTSSPRAYAVPLIIRSLRHADGLGEALVARGADD
jgi:biotin transport system permease protein